jgi:hypothetical protein
MNILEMQYAYKDPAIFVPNAFDTEHVGGKLRNEVFKARRKGTSRKT